MQGPPIINDTIKQDAPEIPDNSIVNQARQAARMRRLSYLNNQTTTSKTATYSLTRQDSLIKENEISDRSQRIIEFSKQAMV